MDSALSTAAVRKVTRELYAIHDDPPEGIRLILNEDSIADIQAWILGPAVNGWTLEGTPYEGGCFRVRIQLVPDFPNSPPKCYFLTRIFHPNVSTQGDVCVSVLKKDWKKELGIRHVLLVVKCLLICPNPESALNEEAGRQLLERYEDYARHARLMTDVHARAYRNEVFPATPIPPTSREITNDNATTCVSVLNSRRVDMPKDRGEATATAAAAPTDNMGTLVYHSLARVQPESSSVSLHSTSLNTVPISQSLPSSLSCSSTPLLQKNSRTLYPPRPCLKRKLSIDEQQQQQQQQQQQYAQNTGTIATTVLNRPMDGPLTLPDTGTAIACMNYTHVTRCPHSCSKPPLIAQPYQEESKPRQKGSESHPGRVQPSDEQDVQSHALLRRGDWPTTTLTGLTASSRCPGPFHFAMTHDQDKKRSLRRL